MSATNEDTTNGEANNTSTFISALLIGLVTFAVFIFIFFLLHNRDRKVFQPRLTLVPPKSRPPELPPSIFAWFTAIIKEPDTTVLQMQGPDAYFFMRFFRLMLKIFFPGWLLTWVILLPLAATGGGGNKGLNIFNFGNMVGSKQNHHIGHIIVGVAFFSYILYLLREEYRHYYTVRQEWLSSPAHAGSASARTVMINNLPKKLLSESALAELATTATKGTVEKVWLVRNVDPIAKLFEERNQQCLKLEAATGAVQALAFKLANKSKDPEPETVEAPDLVSRSIPRKKRPTHYSGAFLFSKKVDTLEYSPDFIRDHNEKLEAEKAKLEERPLVNSAFIRFTTMVDAHAFCQVVASAAGSRLIDASNEVVPEGVVWGNLSLSPYSRKIRVLISWAITIGLIIIWLPLVAFVGVVSNLNTLANVSWLRWINDIPPVVQGILQGILPPVAFAVLFMLLPIFLRLCIQLQGETRQSDVERILFARFWIFQVIHGFLIITVASGLPSVLAQLNKPEQLPFLLATQLPSSSIFFLTFVVTTTLSSAGKMNARLVPYIMKYLTFLRGNTPRKVSNWEYKMASMQLSTTWPPLTLLGCIGIAYALIQPIVVAFAALGFAVLYVAYKYSMIWVLDQPNETDTGGLIYNRALNTVFTSLYVAEICAMGLFFLQRSNDDGSGGMAAVGTAGGIIFAIMIAVTAGFQIWIQRQYTVQKLTYVDGSYTTGTRSLFGLKSQKHGGHGTEGDPPAREDVIVEEHHKQETTTSGIAPYGKDTAAHAQAFEHPAIWKPQPIVWIADDPIGIGKEEVERFNSLGVSSTYEHARIEAVGEGHKGKGGQIVITRGPPDQDWYDEDEEN